MGYGAHNPLRHDPEQVLAHLRAMSREPFQEALRDLLAAQPGLKELKAWAGKSPDRWAQAIAIFGRLSAFGDKLEIDGKFSYERKSDADLIEEMERSAMEANPELVAMGYRFDVFNMRWVQPGEDVDGGTEGPGDGMEACSPGLSTRPPQEAANG